jgi:EmrB/QacA subfamily drug resistance transporter
MNRSEDRVSRKVWAIAAACVCGPLMSGLDSTMVNVSLDAIGRDFGVTFATIQWVTSGYLLALALSLPLAAWLADRIGARRVFMVCFAWFVIFSALCGSAQSAPMLIAFRVLQGIAGGLLAPMMQMQMAQHAGRHMARVIGIAGMPIVIGQMVGPTLGGLILTYLDWRWIFYVNVPIGLLAIVFAWRVLPRETVSKHVRLDLLGFAMISPGLALLLQGLASLAHGEAMAALSLVCSSVLLGAFARRAMADPEHSLIDLRLFRSPTFRASAMTQFLSNAVIFGGQLLLPLYLLQVRGFSPAATGLLLAPMGLGYVLALPFIGRVSETLGARHASSMGVALVLLGTLPFAIAGSDAAIGLLCAAMVVRGIGCGCINIPSISAAYSSTPRESLGQATTAINICQRLGGPTGTTALAVWLQYALVHASSPANAYATTFWALCGITAIALLATMGLPGRSLPEE